MQRLGGTCFVECHPLAEVTCTCDGAGQSAVCAAETAKIAKVMQPLISVAAFKTAVKTLHEGGLGDSEYEQVDPWLQRASRRQKGLDGGTTGEAGLAPGYRDTQWHCNIPLAGLRWWNIGSPLSCVSNTLLKGFLAQGLAEQVEKQLSANMGMLRDLEARADMPPREAAAADAESRTLQLLQAAM